MARVQCERSNPQKVNSHLINLVSSRQQKVPQTHCSPAQVEQVNSGDLPAPEPGVVLRSGRRPKQHQNHQVAQVKADVAQHLLGLQTSYFGKHHKTLFGDNMSVLHLRIVWRPQVAKTKNKTKKSLNAPLNSFPPHERF